MRTGAAFEVILIPGDGSRLKRVTTSLTAITADDRLHDNIHDARLTHIPEMRVFWYNNTAAFVNRVSSAAQVYHHPTDPGLNGRYYLIKTLAADEEGLPLNEHEFWKNIPNRKVWGDVVIFKVSTLDENGRAIQIDVLKSMLNDDGLRVVRDIMTTAACLGLVLCTLSPLASATKPSVGAFRSAGLINSSDRASNRWEERMSHPPTRI